MFKNFTFFLVILFSSSAVQAQVPVQMTTGIFINHQPEKNPSTNPDFFASCQLDGRYYLWLQFNGLPNDQAKAMLLATGVHLFDYLPVNTFFASFPMGYNYNQLHSFDVYAVTKPALESKISSALFNPSSIAWAAEGSNLLKVNIIFISILSSRQLAEQLVADNILFEQMPTSVSGPLTVKADMNALQAIARHPLVQFIEPIASTPVTEDQEAISDHRISAVSTNDNYTTGKKYDGTGVNIAIGDDGFVGPHIDFKGRLVNYATITDAIYVHADHCAGIIAGSPNFSPTEKGQAPGAKLFSYDNYGDYNFYPGIYNTDSVRITSHSLGQICNDGYTTNARLSDQLLRTYPLMNHVHSAGNSGNTTCGGLDAGWKTITGGFKAAKNVITVGNVTKKDELAPTSSKGPTADGRIKPDIMAVGTYVNSTYPNNTYNILSGTSMSCPAVAGGLALLTQAYKSKNDGKEPDGALIKAIALNTADDLGNKGPDFSFGWGRINIRRAINCVEENRFFNDSISQGSVKNYSIVIPANVATAKIMLYWTDYEGTVGAASSLVNNLDASLSLAGLLHYNPWVLTAGSPATAVGAAALATKGVETLNNVEQIQLDNPAAGEYLMEVKGSAVPKGPQPFVVAKEFIYKNEITVTYPFGGESFVPGEVQTIRWDADAISTDVFTVHYTPNENIGWTVIGSNINGNTRYLDWTVPNIITDKARIMVTKNGIASDVSDTTFVVLTVPTNIKLNAICSGRSSVSWNPVSGASGYDVFKLGKTAMELIGSSSSSFAVLANVDTSQNWYSVRAKLSSSGSAGRRSQAIAHTNKILIECGPLPLRLLSFSATLNNGLPLLKWVVDGEETGLYYEVQRSTNAAFSNYSVVGKVDANQRLGNYQMNDAVTISTGIFYYRLKLVDAERITYSSINVLRINNGKSGFTIFPNPANNQITILAEEDSYISAKIYNSLGQVLINGTKANLQAGTGFTINVSQLSAGIYFLLLYDEKTGRAKAKQILTIKK